MIYVELPHGVAKVGLGLFRGQEDGGPCQWGLLLNLTANIPTPADEHFAPLLASSARLRVTNMRRPSILWLLTSILHVAAANSNLTWNINTGPGLSSYQISVSVQLHSPRRTHASL